MKEVWKKHYKVKIFGKEIAGAEKISVLMMLILEGTLELLR
jgi:hypothetical protein